MASLAEVLIVEETEEKAYEIRQEPERRRAAAPVLAAAV